MKIKHFGGIEYANNISEFSEILQKKYGDGVNEFWITNNTQENPCLVVLVNKEMANLTYFPDEESLGFQSVGCQTNQKNDYCIFYTNTPEEEIEIRRDSIISVDKAFEAAKKFFYKREMPDYNFQVEDFHTYYVGKNGILVHNADYSTVVTPDMENKILEGERVGSSNRIKGGHSPKINDANPKYSVEVQQTFADGTKKIKFITEFPDGNVSKIKTSTIFPDNWSDAKIIDSIKQVGDGVPIGKRIADNSYLYRDIIDGVQIEVIKQGNNVIAGYPTGGGTTGLPTGFTSK